MLFRIAEVIIALILLGADAAKASGAALSFGGVPLAPGSTVQAHVPLSAQEKSFAAHGDNPVPQSALAALATPANFDPAKTWPVLVVLSTSDFKRQNRDDLAAFYRRTALAEGWVLLAGDGPQPARNDTAGWRAAMTLAAVDALHRSFPGSNKWPMVCAGFSGGARRAGFIAPLLAKNGCRIAGIYLTGVNEDYLSEGYKRVQPGADFLRTPIFVAIGRDDPVATQAQQYAVISSIKQTGFTQIRIGSFRGGHEVNDAQTATALRWFHSLNL